MINEQFLRVLAHLVFLKNYYHNGHHVVARVPFFADHAALGEFYSQVDADYDSLAEKFVSLFGSDALSLSIIMRLAAEKASSVVGAKENKDIFATGLNHESDLCKMLESLIKGGNLSEGTKNLLANVCTNAESRQYKIKQRIK